MHVLNCYIHTSIPSVDLALESQSLPGASAFRGAPAALTAALPAAWPEHFDATWRFQSLAPSPHLRLWLGNVEISEEKIGSQISDNMDR